MHREITVWDVIEKNDCSGKKHFFVTSMEDDETVKSLFKLASTYMFPDEKLLLSSVSPMDKALVVFDHRYNDTVVGEYVNIISEVSTRSPICRCETLLVSDGFDVYCPNAECPLTLTARIERLANTVFGDTMTGSLNPVTGVPYRDFSNLEYLSYFKPFSILAQGVFWRYPGGSLEHILLTRIITPAPNIATFLVEPLFKAFVLNLYQHDQIDSGILDSIWQFYADMLELVQRRDYESNRQDFLIKAFLSSLGIESLTPFVIDKLVTYEHHMGDNNIEPMLCYAYALTHPEELVKELGLHYSEATTIVNEVYRRRYELCDIFGYYTNTPQDIFEIFRHMM